MSATIASTNDGECNNALQLSLYPPDFTPPPPCSSTITSFSISPWFKERTGFDFTDEDLAIFLMRGIHRLNYRVLAGEISPERYRTICEFIQIHGERIYLYYMGLLSPEEIMELGRKQLELHNVVISEYWTSR